MRPCLYILLFCILTLPILYEYCCFSPSEDRIQEEEVQVLPLLDLLPVPTQDDEDEDANSLPFCDTGQILLKESTPRARWHWVQQYFSTNMTIRQAEYDAALQWNLDHPHILQVHLLLPNADDFPLLSLTFHDPAHKITPCFLGHRLTYRSAVQYIHQAFANRSVPVILSNGDISMYSGFDRLFPEPKRLYAPARWEPSHCNLTKPLCSCSFGDGAVGGCVDTFAFLSPLPHGSLLEVDQELLNFYLGGRLGGENVFMFELKKRGYRLSNPCKSLILYHHHCSNLRPFSWNETERINVKGRSAVSGPASFL